MLKEGILGEVNPRQEEALSKVLAQANDQLQMINSILQATQIEAGAVRVTSEEVRLHEFFDEMRSAYDLPINKEVTLDWQYPSELPVIKTDGAKLKHIVQNIVNNAIKFTEKGRVTISVQHRLEPNVIEFKVVDTGVGISRAMQPIVFEMFRQADSSENRPFEGVGLGLYIVKKLTGLLGGKVEVESEEGKGSTFIVTMPCDAAPESIDGLPYDTHAQPDYPNSDF
jgi:two-component system chemotaxis sensor kinase CheA